ncbi:hypothetical protein ACLB2K_027311 [Fragaria x ananassa]
MATRQLSSSLMNLKFMQRAIQREELVKKQGEHVEIDAGGVGGFAFPSAVSIQPTRYLVVIEGDPKPAAVRGRMSFKGFNPLIEKLSDTSANPNGDHQRRQHYETQNLNNLSKTNYSSPFKGLSFSNQNQASANPNGYRKRKQFEEVCDTQYPKKWHKTNQGYRQTSLNKSRDSFKKPENRNYKTRPFLGIKEFDEKRLIITINQNHTSANPNGYRKGKQFEEDCDTPYPKKWHKTNQGYPQPSLNKSRGSYKKPENRNYKTRDHS